MSGATNLTHRLTARADDNAATFRVIASNRFRVTQSRSATLTAGYALKLIPGGGTIILDPTNQLVQPGETVELLAIAPTNRNFLRWAGHLDSTENPLKIPVSNHMTIEARFDLRPGDVIWRRSSQDCCSSPLALSSDEKLLVGSSRAGHVVCIDALTGETIWDRLVGGELYLFGQRFINGEYRESLLYNFSEERARPFGSYWWQTATVTADGIVRSGELCIAKDGTIFSGYQAVKGSSPLAKTPWPKSSADAQNTRRAPPFEQVLSMRTQLRTNLLVDFPTYVGKSYTIETTTSIRTGPWIPFTNVLATNFVMRISVPVTDSKLFVRALQKN